MFQTFISRHNSNFFSDKLVLTSVTPASSAPVLQTPKATSSTLYFDSLTVNAGNGGFLHCIQIDTSVNAARSEERFSRNAETDLVCRLLLEKKKLELEHRESERDHLHHGLPPTALHHPPNATVYTSTP